MGKIKYSFLIPYIDRIPQFRTTLESFIYHEYHLRGDIELVIVEDVKNFKNQHTRKNLADLLGAYVSRLPIYTLIAGEMEHWSPVTLFNVAAKHASGEYVILTNPECAHQTNVLKGLDAHFEKFPESYAIASCLSVLAESMTMEQLQHAKGKWYQHSKERNVLVHFCAAMKKEFYEKIGGFDEQYKFGVCFDDDDFRNRVMQAKILFEVLDDLVTVHLNHYKEQPPGYVKLHEINKKYFESVWGSNSFTAEKICVPAYEETEVTP